MQVSTIYPKEHTFASIRSIPFLEIDDKGGEIVQRYESLIEWGRDCKVGEIRYESLGGWTWTWTKREQHWRKEKDQIKILGQEKHTNRGSKLMNFD